MLSVKAREAADTIFSSLWYDPTENQTQSTMLRNQLRPYVCYQQQHFSNNCSTKVTRITEISSVIIDQLIYIMPNHGRSQKF